MNISLPPQGFVPRQAWPEFNLSAAFPTFLSPRGKAGATGVELRFWPLFYEEFIGDAEPVIEPIKEARGHLRISAWRRVSRADVPRGWHALQAKPKYAESFARIPHQGDYTSAWTKSGRYDLRAWRELQETGAYSIGPIEWKELEEAYPTSVAGKKMGDLYLAPIRERVLKKAPGVEHVACFGVKNTTTRHSLVAAIIVINSPTFKSSYYHAGFYTKEAASLPVMVGLMDYWFTVSQKEGFQFLHFGTSWVPGNPVAWKGFSRFKEKFGTETVAIQPHVFKISF